MPDLPDAAPTPQSISARRRPPPPHGVLGLFILEIDGEVVERTRAAYQPPAPRYQRS